MLKEGWVMVLNIYVTSLCKYSACVCIKVFWMPILWRSNMWFLYNKCTEAADVTLANRKSRLRHFLCILQFRYSLFDNLSLCCNLRAEKRCPCYFSNHPIPHSGGSDSPASSGVDQQGLAQTSPTTLPHHPHPPNPEKSHSALTSVLFTYLFLTIWHD